MDASFTDLSPCTFRLSNKRVGLACIVVLRPEVGRTRRQLSTTTASGWQISCFVAGVLMSTWIGHGQLSERDQREERNCCTLCLMSRLYKHKSSIHHLKNGKWKSVYQSTCATISCSYPRRRTSSPNEPMMQTLPNWLVEPTCIFSLCLDKAHMDPFSASS